MKPRGIPIAQIRSDLEADEKVQVLMNLADVREDYYGALGVYLTIVLGAWSKATRMLPSARRRLIPKKYLDLLIECELLDADANVPESSFDNYVGDVLRMRASDADRKRNVRRSPTESDGVPRSPGESIDSSSPLLSYGRTNGERVQGEGAWPYLYTVAVELTGKHVAQGKFADDLCELVVQAGPEPVIAAMRAVAEAMAPVKPDMRALSFGVSNLLRKPPSGKDVAAVISSEDEARRAERIRKAGVYRRERLLAESAAAEAVDPATVGQIMGDIRKVIGR